MLFVAECDNCKSVRPARFVHGRGFVCLDCKPNGTLAVEPPCAGTRIHSKGVNFSQPECDQCGRRPAQYVPGSGFLCAHCEGKTGLGAKTSRQALCPNKDTKLPEVKMQPGEGSPVKQKLPNATDTFAPASPLARFLHDLIRRHPHYVRKRRCPRDRLTSRQQRD